MATVTVTGNLGTELECPSKTQKLNTTVRLVSTHSYDLTNNDAVAKRVQVSWSLTSDGLKEEHSEDVFVKAGERLRFSRNIVKNLLYATKGRKLVEAETSCEAGEVVKSTAKGSFVVG